MIFPSGLLKNHHHNPPAKNHILQNILWYDRQVLAYHPELGKAGFHFSQATMTHLIAAEMCVCVCERERVKRHRVSDRAEDGVRAHSGIRPPFQSPPLCPG